MIDSGVQNWDLDRSLGQQCDGGCFGGLRDRETS